MRYDCTRCGKSYKRYETLSRHKGECGKEKKNKCSFCPHRTHRKDDLKKHIAAIHGILCVFKK